MSDAGFMIYLLCVLLVMLVVLAFAVRQMLKRNRELWAVQQAELKKAGPADVAAVDDDGRVLSTDDLIRAYRQSALLNGWAWVVVAAINVGLAAWLWVNATRWYGGDSLAGTRALAVFSGLLSGVWLVAGVFALRHHNWAIWLGVSVTLLIAMIALVNIMNSFKSDGRFGLAGIYVLMGWPALQFGQNAYRMGREGIPLGIRESAPEPVTSK
ncbi:MAG TPA: hypothetical protein VEA69_03285 [Tepidisphaeraceae bacterium]|nr:hypothetical protein [Tepidisphaeraceae bacterium]